VGWSVQKLPGKGRIRCAGEGINPQVCAKGKLAPEYERRAIGNNHIWLQFLHLQSNIWNSENQLSFRADSAFMDSLISYSTPLLPQIFNCRQYIYIYNTSKLPNITFISVEHCIHLTLNTQNIFLRFGWSPDQPNFCRKGAS